MIKKFIALSMAVLVMALHTVTVYAYNIPNVPIYDNTQRTENGVTGKIDVGSGNPNYQTYHAITSTQRDFGYLSARIFLEDALTNAEIACSLPAVSFNQPIATADASATYGYYTYIRVTGIYQAGTSGDNITTSFGLRKMFIQ